MVVVAAILVLLGVIVALALPLVRRRPTDEPTLALDTSEAAVEDATLRDERDALLVALQDLELDYALGKIDAADYQVLRARAEARAMAVLKAIDTAAAPTLPTVPAPTAVSRQGTAPGSRKLVVLGPRTAEAADAATIDNLPPGRSPGLAARAKATGLVAAGCALVFVFGVVAVVVTGRTAQGGPQPIATLADVGPRALVLAPVDGRRAYLAAADGLWQTADGGRTWTRVDALDAVVLAATLSDATPPPPWRAIVVSYTLPYNSPVGRRFVVAGPSRLARSDDSGRTWQVWPIALGAGPVDVRALAAHASDQRRLWVAAEGVGLFASEDGGETWTQRGSTPPNPTALVAVVDPANTAPGAAPPVLLFLASATEGVLASTDEGRTWGQASGVVSGALPTHRVAALAFDAASGEAGVTPDGRPLQGTLYAGTDQGLFKTVDRGQVWASLTLRVPIAAVAADSSAVPGLVMAVDRDGRVYRSTNRGVTWEGGP
jgi:photosystem II stability/assembly factor-like uncharacterized protein